MLALLLAAAAAPTTAPAAMVPQTPIEAERAFAADAQALGQWTAFRKWAAADAVMFLPQPANAQAALKDRRDPPRAAEWSPTASFVSCDGTVAANTGEWRRPDGSVGYFTTIWVKQPDGGWRWVVDGGDGLPTARPRVATPTVRRAACAALAASVSRAPDPENANGGGHSPDRTLIWTWSVRRDGAREFDVSLYEGRLYASVISDVIGAPPKRPVTP